MSCLRARVSRGNDENALTSHLRGNLTEVRSLLPPSLQALGDRPDFNTHAYANGLYTYLECAAKQHHMSAVLAAAGVFAQAVLITQLSPSANPRLGGAVLCMLIPLQNVVYRVTHGVFKVGVRATKL